MDGSANAVRRSLDKFRYQAEKRKDLKGITQEEKVRRQENANIDAMMRIHKRIDETVGGSRHRRVAQAVVHAYV